MNKCIYYVVAANHGEALNRETVRMGRKQALEVWDSLPPEMQAKFYIWTVQAQNWRPIPKDKRGEIEDE